jgi:hypothetical protein
MDTRTLDLPGAAMAHRRYVCPKCEARSGVNIIYGYPSIEMAEMNERGEIALGGCCVDASDPERRCLSCGHEWRIKRKRETDHLPDDLL